MRGCSTLPLVRWVDWGGFIMGFRIAPLVAKAAIIPVLSLSLLSACVASTADRIAKGPEHIYKTPLTVEKAVDCMVTTIEPGLGQTPTVIPYQGGYRVGIGQVFLSNFPQVAVVKHNPEGGAVIEDYGLLSMFSGHLNNLDKGDFSACS